MYFLAAVVLVCVAVMINDHQSIKQVIPADVHTSLL